MPTSDAIPAPDPAGAWRAIPSLEGLRQALEGLRQAQRERDAALAASRAKDAFLADLSHELRSPLAAMISWMHLLRAGALDAETSQHALDVIERNLKAQAALVDDLLEFARIASGRRTIEAGPVDIVTVVADVLEDHRLRAAAQGIALEGPAQREPLLVRGDARLLAQVVTNLLTNALKFTPSGGSVRVALHGEPTNAVIEIRDDGEGIAPEFLPHVFERARQGGATGMCSRGGLGLGLAIAQRLVEEQGGRIAAESEGSGHGAAFRVVLPRASFAPGDLAGASGPD